MKIILSKTHEESSKKASVQILRQVIEKNNAVLGFATGSSPVVIYENLIKFYKENIVSFKDVTAFNLDEYIGIEKSHQNSYYYFMRDNLFKHIDIKEENCHIENGLASDMNKECELYESLIEEKGGIDLQILGIGANGHIGFNEPSDKISPMTHVVDLTQSTFDSNSKYFSDIKMPTKAVTMGIATIMKSKKIILIASGEAKAKSIFDTVHGEITPEVPSSILRLHSDVTIYVDEDASKLLK